MASDFRPGHIFEVDNRVIIQGNDGQLSYLLPRMRIQIESMTDTHGRFRMMGDSYSFENSSLIGNVHHVSRKHGQGCDCRCCATVERED